MKKFLIMVLTVPLLGSISLLSRGVAAQMQRPQLVRQKPGVPAVGWQCPATHPIKGNLTTYSGERCIYHIPGGQFYEKTRPEMCYVSPPDAIADGCRPSKR